MARLVRPLWSATWMFVVVALVTLGYTSFMFEYARSRSVGPQLTITFDPDPGIAMRCDPGTCPQTDPAPEWTVMGQMRVQEKNGLGGTIEAISLYSRDATVYIPRSASREEIAEENKFAGPRVRLKSSVRGASAPTKRSRFRSSTRTGLVTAIRAALSTCTSSSPMGRAIRR
jgi:hypothetical protein